ncbi:SDR family NAD(P)-dependent oxidoreductase [Stigmatella aurantiaca]|uniref:Oxidoreductase, short chain dehydrogenase/reductase family n=1 Tax=Stigmatella aurantiaca (strain DW4/3-1) TaxID=378806 RepID=Q08NL2_STIAD|nr:SDR family NAD(P)-dependent oxidoreductase [Stigmatella aurantiaca]ADO72217.1 Oxidoreductase, short chain dehydrogenase/reductase family [Stigmatella aurantiaca DW4/3-1]EAU62067.1 oxidoreductase, short chain dehydrogenase/reductase family, putative [Stigmatella aurantiaca DW4/3-1]
MRPPIDFGSILITGACSVLGREFARQLSHRARTLVLVCPHVERLETLSEELQARNPTLGVVLLRADIALPNEVDRVMNELASHLITPGVLVSAAGVGPQAPFAQQSWEDVQRTLQANIVAPLLLMHRLLPSMLARKSGGILHVGSGNSQLFLPGLAAASAAHRCLDGFLESLRLEVEGSGVVITYAAPGPVGDPRREDPAAPEAHAPFFRLSAAQCARKILAGFDRAEPLVYPGTGHRWVMGLLPMLPRPLRRALGRFAAGRRAEEGTGGSSPRLARGLQALLPPGTPSPGATGLNR